MIALPSLEQAAEVRVSRQGGVAFVLALVRTRRFELGRARQPCARRSMPPCTARPDRRAMHAGKETSAIFASRCIFGAGSRAEPLRFDVPEELAPHDLVWLWRSAPAR